MGGVGKVIRRAFGRFGRDRKGNAAVEFGLIALPFFLLTFGLGEIAMIGFVQTSLDYAVSETARRIRTGQAQNANQNYTQMQTALCGEMNQILSVNCVGDLFLDVDTFASFVTVQNNSPISNGNFTTGGFGYNPGSPASIVVVRAYYRWRIITPLFNNVFSNVAGGQRILVSTMMFRNEPY